MHFALLNSFKRSRRGRRDPVQFEGKSTNFRDSFRSHLYLSEAIVDFDV